MYSAEQISAFKELKKNTEWLWRSEARTIRGQIRAGDTNGAMKGLHKIVERRMAEGRKPS